MLYQLLEGTQLWLILRYYSGNWKYRQRISTKYISLDSQPLSQNQNTDILCTRNRRDNHFTAWCFQSKNIWPSPVLNLCNLLRNVCTKYILYAHPL